MSKPVYEKVAQVLSNHTRALTEDERHALIGLLYPSYPVDINFDKTIEQLILEGKYKLNTMPVTSEDFPSEEKGQKQENIFVVDFDHSIWGMDVVRELARMGLRPATIKELLSLGCAYPDLQHKWVIFSYGSTRNFPDGMRFVPFIDGIGSQHLLNLLPMKTEWGEGIHFAAVYVGIS